MDHSWGKEIFEEIQARPYGLCLAPGVPADNCFFKSLELVQRLALLGYTVRCRMGDSYWDKKLIPAELIDMLPSDLPCTHFYAEVLIDNEWCIADPSLQPSMAKHGFTIGSFGKGGKLNFPVTRVYTQEEMLAAQEKWKDQKYADDFFARCVAGWKAIDQWFKEHA